ncbi:MAG: 4Fe-4S binding protein [Synergistaceae bacterium]|jgi:ferredoxin|nr:4Fe-4S binding protein [Synergistaceae bacterium]
MAKATVDADNCVGCAACESTCDASAISIEDGKAVVDQEKCIECGACVSACPVEAISQ